MSSVSTRGRVNIVCIYSSRKAVWQIPKLIAIAYIKTRDIRFFTFFQAYKVFAVLLCYILFSLCFTKSNVPKRGVQIFPLKKGGIG